MTYSAIFTEKFVQDYKKLDHSMKVLVDKRLKKIIESPSGGKNLSGKSNFFRERLLHHRIVYFIEGEKITFLRIGKRDSVYDI